jgi:ankyrin repeat protein
VPLSATNCGPGCGKSVLSKALVDENLLGQQENDTIVCYFFFKDTSPEQRSPVNALSALLHQLFASRQGASLIKHALLHFRKDKDQFATNLEALWTIVRSIMEDPEHPRIIFLLDALDECKSDCQPPLIRQLKRCEETRAPEKNDAKTFQFICTSRPYWDIESEFQELIEDMPNIRLPAEDESEALRLEINCVVEARLNELERSNVIASVEARDMLRDGLSNVENRTYLWIHIIFARLKKKPRLDVKTIQTFLKELPKSVEDAYEAILKRSKEPEDAKRLLHIIVAAKRPLFLKEIAVALYITDEVHSHEDLEIQQDSQLKVVLRHLCGLFVSIVDSKVFLIHQTAKEFFLSRTCLTVRPGCWRQSLESRVSNLVLARCCLRYLLFDEFKIARVFDRHDFVQYSENRGLSPGARRLSAQYSFLDYSSQNWFKHIQEAMEIDDSTKRMCLDVCNVQSNYFWLWSLIYRPIRARWDPNEFKAKYNHILFVLAYFGLDLVMAEVLEHTTNVDIRNRENVTPLYLAAEQGHEPVVRLLLHKQANANSKARYWHTPLMRAATFNHEAIVKLLLDKGADIDIQDIGGQTPLSYAAEYGCETAARLLLQTGVVDVDSKDNDGRTPLSLAAAGGATEVVELLLQTGVVEVNSKDNDNRTPLSWTAADGAPEVIELLLQTGVAEVNSKDNDNRTPLSWTAADGALEVLELLLQTGVAEVNSKDNDGRTPFSWATDYENAAAVVELLLKTGGVEVDSKDNCNLTPLSWAARSGNSLIIESLLETGKADVEWQDDCGRTPLLWAFEHNGLEEVKALLNIRKTQTCLRDIEITAPLALATPYIKLESSTASLHTSKSRPESRSSLSQVVFLLAVKMGNSRLLEELLGVECVDVNMVDEAGRTPLSWAAQLGSENIVKTLLLNKARIDLEDIDGRTPLSWAAQLGFENIVKTLLLNKARTDLEDIDGRTPSS